MIKTLFVSSGQSKTADIAPFIKAQGKSLNSLGIDVHFFPIKGKGFHGYLKGIFDLQRYLKMNPVDIIHAHYTLSGWLVLLSLSRKPVVLSLMGTDTYGEYIGINKIRFSSRYLILLTFFIQPFVKAIICKSENIQSYLYLKKKSHVIPNGISLEQIRFHEHGFREELGLAPDKQYILFLGDKKEIRKNYELARTAFEVIESDDIRLIAPYPVSHEKAIQYLNAVDVLIVPSLMEGSPNVVKEAMACNCPVVATDVGDVAWLFGKTPGYFLTSFDPEDVAKKLKNALDFSKYIGRTRGRERIIKLNLDAGTVADRIFRIYKDILEK